MREDLIDRLRSEAEISDRPGQMDRLNALADEFAAALAAAQQRIAELERELENERARGIHTCHDQCQRPLCVAQRRIAELESQLRERSMTERISNTELLIDAALAAQQPGGSDNDR